MTNNFNIIINIKYIFKIYKRKIYNSFIKQINILMIFNFIINNLFFELLTIFYNAIHNIK